MSTAENNIIVCGRYIIELLHSVLYDRKPEEKPEGISFEEVFALAKKHCLQTMTYEGIARLENRPEAELKDRWRKSQTTNIAKNLIQRSERDVILSALTQQGIDLLPLKGCQMIEMYPKPEYRQMSDLDILCREEQAGQIRESLTAMGYECDAFDAKNDDSYVKKPYMHVEMHRHLFGKNCWEELLKEYYREEWARARQSSENEHLYYFSWEDYYVYMLAHFFKHFNSGGSGIRNVMDVHVFLSQYGDVLDRAYVDRELEKMGLTEFCRDMEELAEQWFGETQDLGSVREDLEETIFTSGAYGLLYNVRTRKIRSLEEESGRGKILPRIKYILWVLFPDYDRLVGQYPQFVGKQKWLPLLWFYRIGDKLIRDPERMTGNIKAMRDTRKKDHENEG